MCLNKLLYRLRLWIYEVLLLENSSYLFSQTYSRSTAAAKGPTVQQKTFHKHRTMFSTFIAYIYPSLCMLLTFSKPSLKKILMWQMWYRHGWALLNERIPYLSLRTVTTLRIAPNGFPPSHLLTLTPVLLVWSFSGTVRWSSSSVVLHLRQKQPAFYRHQLAPVYTKCTVESYTLS